jgi:two-component system CheB/CheR fusion protein
MREALETANAQLRAANDVLSQRVADLTRAETALRASERRSQKALDQAGIGLWEWDPRSDETWWSPVVYRLWGLPVAERPPPHDERPVHPDDRDGYEAAIREAARTGRLHAEWRVLLPNHRVRWLAETGRLERDEAGERILGVTQDITERKKTEARLQLLLGELHHRVRNVLGVVRSIVARSVRSATSLDELAAHLDGRLDTLSRTQGVLARTPDAVVALEDIVREEMVALAVREDHVTIEGPDVTLKRQAAETMALALHELSTNAVKYGALSGNGGRLSVTWRIVDGADGPTLTLEWRETGVRALDIKPTRSGFGRELIERGLPYELGATTALEFGRGGLRALIQTPLTDQVAELGQNRREP